MPFSSGQKIFGIIFIIAFLGIMIWAYVSDSKMHRSFFKNSWVVFISVVLLLFLLVFLINYFHKH